MFLAALSHASGAVLGATEDSHSFLGYRGFGTFQGGTKTLRDLCLLASSNKSTADDVKLLGRIQDLPVSATPLSKADGREGLWAFHPLQAQLGRTRLDLYLGPHRHARRVLQGHIAFDCH